jgi:uncharacterized protein DUF7007
MEAVMNTPWGKSDSKTTLAKGVSWVGTSSHGGFAITPTAALRYLSTAAVSRGLKYGGYYFFEEDCDFAIVMLEMHEFLMGVSVITFPVNLSTKEKLIEGLSRWHADYLIERGITPDPDGLKFYNDNRKADCMRRDKSPDLIVSASGDWHQDCPKGFVLVTTASGERWLVNASEYDNRANLNLLSNYTEPKAVA